MTPEQKRIEELEARVAELEEGQAALEWRLEELLGVDDQRPKGITPCMFEVASLLAARSPRVVTKEALYHAALKEPLESIAPDKTLQVQILKLRREFKGTGITIETVRGIGYAMTPENAAKWRALVAKYNPQLEDAA